MQAARTAVLIVTLAMVMCVQGGARQLKPSAPGGAVVFGMQLLPGYQHQRVAGFDVGKGIVWKEGGPRIDYEFGEVANNAARHYRAERRATRTVTLDANGHFYDFVFDDAAETIVGSIGFLHFTATKVRTKTDVADVLLMAMSFDGNKLP